jgi:membrane protease YdiL (CAAX protease family)
MSKVGLFLVVTFVWSWGQWWPAVMFASGAWTAPEGLPPIFVTGGLAAWGPLIGALVVAAADGGFQGVKRLLRRLVQWRFAGACWAAAVLLLPVVIGAAWVVAGVVDGVRPASEALENPAVLPIAFLYILVLGGPLQEEAGWRGTLLERTQSRYAPLAISVVVGLVWAIWHLPLFDLPSAGIYYEKPFWGLALSTVLLSVLLTWLYNRTGGSLLAVMVMHASFNWAHYAFPALESDSGGLAYFALLIAACAAILWLSGPSLGKGRSDPAT